MWKNAVERGTLQMTIWHMRTVCWITSGTNTHAGCVILIAFPLQQWLHESVCVLRYTYTACLVQHCTKWQSNSNTRAHSVLCLYHSCKLPLYLNIHKNTTFHLPFLAPLQLSLWWNRRKGDANTLLFQWESKVWWRKPVTLSSGQLVAK